MKIEEAKFTTKDLIITGELASEEAVMDYYETQGYEAFKNYSTYLHRLYKVKSNDNVLKNCRDKNMKRVGYAHPNVSEEIIKLFAKYPSGYPDLILVKEDKEVLFTEIKVGMDSLRPNQVEFLTQLAKYSEVIITRIYNEQSVGKTENDILRSKFHRKLTQHLNNAKKRGYKKLWVTAQMYRYFGEKVLENQYLEMMHCRTGLTVRQIKLFLARNQESLEEKHQKLERGKIKAKKKTNKKKLEKERRGEVMKTQRVKVLDEYGNIKRYEEYSCR